MNIVFILNVIMWMVAGGMVAAWVYPVEKSEDGGKLPSPWKRYAAVAGAAIVMGLIIYLIQRWSTPKKASFSEETSVEIPTVGTAIESTTSPVSV
jgi:peptidoglycan/LPS O-acetylase OafA/YrhL